jgi:hypothetical protein
MFFKKTKEHLLDSDKKYTEHLYDAIYHGYELFIASLASFIHGFFPFLFNGYSAKKIIDIYYKVLHNHKNKEYQKHIEKYK